VERVVSVAHVDQLDRRQLLAVDALGQLQPLHADPALGPRRRATAQKHRVGELGTPLGHMTRVVAGVALVLVGGVVLLIDHDQPEIAYGSEDS
jgi:hypothetical protein